ncbi:uncharacterized membrane protein YgdD (TMEM256/DUF423 family) [Alkalibacillus almallahensis]|nr:uncharacterized membrane protein YgdD (TMEM256/DUF423 family) [Alkalibacillus almallahensis]
MTFIYLLPLLVPMPFLFHYYETSQYPNDAPYLFIMTLVFVIVTGLLSKKVKIRYMIIANIFSVIVSIQLGEMYIIPPNDIWFKPFRMSFVIMVTGILIFLGMLIVRSIFNKRIFELK